MSVAKALKPYIDEMDQEVIDLVSRVGYEENPAMYIKEYTIQRDKDGGKLVTVTMYADEQFGGERVKENG